MEETKTEEILEEERDYKTLYEEEHNKYLYLLADFSNFSKKSEERISRIRESSNDGIILNFVRIYDTYLYGYSHYESHDEANMLISELKNVFSDYNVELYGEVGDKFDESIHSASMLGEDPHLGHNEIITVIKKGVRIGDRILRYADVIVNK